MGRYKIAEITCKTYLIAWGVLLTGMWFYGVLTEGFNGSTIVLINEVVGPAGASIAVMIFAFSALIMGNEANRGRCP